MQPGQVEEQALEGRQEVEVVPLTAERLKAHETNSQSKVLRKRNVAPQSSRSSGLRLGSRRSRREHTKRESSRVSSRSMSRNSIRGLMLERRGQLRMSSSRSLPRLDRAASQGQTQSREGILKPRTARSIASSRCTTTPRRIVDLPFEHKVLYSSNRRARLLEELRETQERMTELMEQRKAHLMVTLAQTNNMLRKKLEHTYRDESSNGPETRRRAREAVMAIEGGDATLGPGLRRLAPLARTNLTGTREHTDSSYFAIGAGVGCVDGLKGAVSTSKATYGCRIPTGGSAALGLEGGGSRTDRSNLARVNRLPGVMQHPLRSSELMRFREKAVKLGINLKRTGH